MIYYSRSSIYFYIEEDLDRIVAWAFRLNVTDDRKSEGDTSQA